MKRMRCRLVFLLIVLLAGMLMPAALAAVGDDSMCPNAPSGIHLWDSGRIIEPTCTASGGTVFTCSACGRTSENRNVPPLGHDWQVNDVLQPTCTEPGYEHLICVRCLMDGGAVTKPALGHQWGEWETLQPATCTEGSSSRHACLRCGVTESGQETGPLGHEYEVTAGKAPTYTEDGYNIYVCRRNAEHTYMEFLPKIEHNHQYQAEETVAATCTGDGLTTFTCVFCGDSFTEVRPALGHAWGAWTAVQPATCTAPGMEARVCANDERHTENRTLAALGHDWGEWKTTQAADCGHTGTRTKTCRRDASHIQTETLPIAGSHSWSLWQIETPGTCVKKEMRVRQCYNCGETGYSYGAYGEHQWGEWAVIAEPTDTEPGVEERVCKIHSAHREQRDFMGGESSEQDIMSQLLLKITWAPDAGEKKRALNAVVPVQCTVSNWSDTPLYFIMDDSGAFINYVLPRPAEYMEGSGYVFRLEPQEECSYIYLADVMPEHVENALLELNAVVKGYRISDAGEWILMESNPLTVEIPLTLP